MEKSKKEEAKLEAEETFWEGPPSSTEAPRVFRGSVAFLFLCSFAGCPGLAGLRPPKARIGPRRHLVVMMAIGMVAVVVMA